MKFNEKLQKLRKEKGLSQEALAEMLGVSRQAVSKWESGQSYPEMDKLITLSGIFGVTLDSLVKDEDLQNDSHNTVSSTFWMTRGSVFEYKSQKHFLGLPLVHIHIGHGLKKAKGIIAIGNVSTGIISMGLFARGILSFGLLSLGLIGIGSLSLGILLSIGAVSLGIFSIGAVALGIFTIGALSVGMFSFGACAVASHVAIGDHAYGHIAIGRIAKGAKTFIDTSQERNFSKINVDAVRKAILDEYPHIWNWIVSLMTSFIGK